MVWKGSDYTEMDMQDKKFDALLQELGSIKVAIAALALAILIHGCSVSMAIDDLAKAIHH